MTGIDPAITRPNVLLGIAVTSETSINMTKIYQNNKNTHYGVQNNNVLSFLWVYVCREQLHTQAIEYVFIYVYIEKQAQLKKPNYI